MSTALQLPAHTSLCPSRYCGKHPQGRGVGVCSACLASKLSSLIHSGTDFAPGSSCAHASLRNSSLQHSVDSPHHPDQGHLQAIDGEAESSAKGVEKGTPLSSDLEVPLTTSDLRGCREGELAGNDSVQSKHTRGQTSLIPDEVYPIEEEKCNVEQDIKLNVDSLDGVKTKANPYLRANKPIKCKRSKSLCALRGDSLRKVEQEAHTLESAATVKGDQRITGTGAKKVTLLTLFHLDNEDKWRDRGLMAPDTRESAEGYVRRFSADCKPTTADEGIDGSSICESKTIEAADDNQTHSHRCVPSASALSSSVCPSVPSKLKHSTLLNSLLCRKKGDGKRGSGSDRRKPFQVKDSSRANFSRSFHEGGLVQVNDNGGFIRATYIASETRDQSLRRCKSKLARSVARSSVSSSQPEESSPSLSAHGIDMRSERNFNLSARVLAAELPFIMASSAEATPVIPCNAKSPSATADREEMLRRQQEEHHLAHSAASVREWEIGEVMESAPFSVSGTQAQDNEDAGFDYAEMPFSERSDAAYVPSISEANTADAPGMSAFMARATIPELEAHDGSFFAGAAQDQGMAVDTRDGMATYITVPAGKGSYEGAAAVGCRSLISRTATSFGKSIGGGIGQQGTSKLVEKLKRGGAWEAYSCKSGKGVRRCPSPSSRTGKIAPARSGLLRFYLTPLRASGRSRVASTRRPPNRHFWPLLFI